MCLHCIQVQCMKRMELSCQLMLKSFIEVNARHASKLNAQAQHAVYLKNYAQLAPGAAKPNIRSVDISSTILHLSRLFDRVAIMGCLVFSEIPAHNKVSWLPSRVPNH